ncbi:alpha/beta hydrolase family protein [Peristeroidobacter agariperforans]|uniref:alpha/beta hydrolase family protein n=1 Tax=Peristeroidobacter agariperforans TaxID=268404 RepID=UPI0013007357|nr:prolyl oligopeptidase family serine peptidase [Peristeroidobacter agariperforans]
MRIGYAALASFSFAIASPASALSNRDFDCTSTRVGEAGSVVIKTTLGETPALVRIPSKIGRSPIVLWHGFGPPASEQALMEALPLDDVPAVKVYLGLPLFGARAPAGGSNELARRQQEDLATLVFEPAVMGAAKELPAVVRALEERNCLKRGERIGLFGFSAGGAAVFYALAERDVRIGAAVTLNASTGLSASVNAYERATKGSYNWTGAARRLAQRSDAAGRAKDIATGHPPPALLIIHGNDDAMLTPEVASTLHSALLPAYREALATEQLQLLLVPGLAHGWTSSGSQEALRSSIAAWFHNYLWPAGSTR